VKNRNPVATRRKPQRSAHAAEPPVGRGRTNRQIVWILAALAAIRVFVYCAIFPFFNNVDEPYHFDLVVKYAHGEIPRRIVPISQESARFIILYGTPEYLSGPAKFPNGKISPPTWTYPADQIAVALPIALARWRDEPNHEATEPPLYYAIGAVWYRLGRVLGIEGGFLLYWIRFLNPLLAAALVWIGFHAAREACPERPLVYLGVPALLAAFPQDTFYSIQSDVLSPIVFGLAFIGVLKWLRTDAPGIWLAVFTGGTLAAAGLVKGANWPLVAVALFALLFHGVRAAHGGKLKQALPASLILAACIVLPLGAWLVRNAWMIGDLTGTAEKTQALGWTRKPLATWWRHPIFTPSGLTEFWTQLMASFWRGEFVWFGERLASGVMDAFYWASSLVFLAVAAASVWRPRKNAAPWEGRVIALSISIFAAGVAFLAVMSMAFDFGSCAYPSQAHPFFTSGRLITGALVPFALLYVYGLDRAFARFKSPWPGALVLAGILFFVTVSEVDINSAALSSAYNWFGLWAGKG
jgi:Predicted membrane protein (DUF2142)